jgi:hypothetical protein
VLVGDETMSVMDIWGAEYQENDAILIGPEARAARACGRTWRNPRLTAALVAAQPLAEVGTKSVMGDACAPLASNGDGLEAYKCRLCGNVSEWHFGIAPVAVLIYSAHNVIPKHP